jgi:hypothetical protein
VNGNQISFASDSEVAEKLKSGFKSVSTALVAHNVGSLFNLIQKDRMSLAKVCEERLAALPDKRWWTLGSDDKAYMREIVDQEEAKLILIEREAEVVAELVKLLKGMCPNFEPTSRHLSTLHEEPITNSNNQRQPHKR